MKRLSIRNLAVLVVTVAGVSGVMAYESYHDPNLDDDGYCASCHPGFGGGRSDALHNFHTGGSTPVTTSCNLCHTGSGRDNPLIMWSFGDNADGLGCTGCHGRDYGETIEANYRGFPTLGKPKASGFGLRKHHLNSGVTVCLDCHPDVAQGAIFAENVNPPYYALSSVGLGGVPMDSCDNEDSQNDADAIGLDNDGDLLYDGADPDCVVVEPDINLSPPALDFGSVTIGASANLTTEVQNLGTADLTVTLISRCAGTSAEYTWSPGAAFTVLPGGSQTLTVTYAPTDEGGDPGCLEIQSDDPDEPTVTLDLNGTGAPPAGANIVLDPPSLDFGTVFLGDAPTLTTQIRNTGTADLLVSSIALCAGTSSEYGWSPNAPLTVPPGGSQALTVTYAPLDSGADVGCLEIQSNDPLEPLVTLDLSGAGAPPPEPNIALVPPSLDFGAVFTGGSSGLTSEVQNTGTADLVVSSIALCAGTSSEYSWSPSAPFTVPPGGSQALTVTYAPADEGTDVGCLEIQSNDPDEPTAILDLSGSSSAQPEPDIVLNPPLLDFGSVLVRDTRQRTTEVQNIGSADLIVWNITRCVGTSSEYTWRPSPPLIVPPGGSETLTVTYAPADETTDLGCLELVTNDPDEPTVNVDLVGAGTAVREPDIALDPAALDFGTVAVGNSASLTAEIRNTGTTWLSVSSITLCAGTSAEYTWTPDAPLSIAADSSRTLTVTYAPVDLGSDAGCLEIQSDDPDEPTVNLDLTGTAPGEPEPNIALDPPSLDFGTVLLGVSSSLTTEVRNTGTADLLVSGIALCAGTSAEYSWTPGAPFTVPPGGGQALTVTYAPLDAGADPGCLEIASNDPDEPTATLSLAGTGAPPPEPDIALDPPSLDFGTVFIGDSSSLTTQVKNMGTADLDVSSIALCSATSAEYSWSPDAPLTIPPGGSQALVVTYAPADVGSDVGCLEIFSNDPDAPRVELGLSGAGEEVVVEEPDIVLDPASLDFGTVFTDESSSMTTEIRNAGTADLAVSGITLCAGTSAEYTWIPDAPLTVPPGASRTLTLTYAPVDVGMDQGCLEIQSNDPDEPMAQLALNGNGADRPTVFVDLDVRKFDATKRVKLRDSKGGGGGGQIRIRLSVFNAGADDEPRPATVTGVQNGQEVYNQTVMVSSPVGDKGTTFDFPSFSPVEVGDIQWTATIADDDPDLDEATAVTEVAP